MEALGTAFVYAFYGLMIAAVAYFVHKVFWFIQFRRVQDRLVARALERLRETTHTSLIRWDRGAESSWTEAIGGDADESPVAYVRRIELDLFQLEKALEHSHTSIELAFARALEGEPPEDGPVRAVRMPRLFGPPDEIHLDLRFPAVREPRKLDDDLYKLEFRSRYGLVRRGLAFLVGAADVVYSSQHVAKMTQNVEVPMGVILRRLSLVALILLAIVIDIVFGVRLRMADFVGRWMDAHVQMDSFGPWLRQYVPATVSLLLWLAIYGSLYLGLFLFLRRRSLEHVHRLREMREEAERERWRILDRHVQALRDWGVDYARTLDEAAGIAVLQAEMLIGRTRHRLRRRLASGHLLEHAERVAAAFFARLPESSRMLTDAATEHRHSFWHALWPRPSEMRYQVEQAKHRAAWRHIEVATNALRGEQPDPAAAEDLWRNLVGYCRMFPDVVPVDTRAALDAAHAETLRELTTETEADLHDLDRRLGQLAEALRQTFAAAGPLVESRVDLANESVEFDIARLAADVLRVRERARLEAMAFEI